MTDSVTSIDQHVRQSCDLRYLAKGISILMADVTKALMFIWKITPMKPAPNLAERNGQVERKKTKSEANSWLWVFFMCKVTLSVNELRRYRGIDERFNQCEGRLLGGDKEVRWGISYCTYFTWEIDFLANIVPVCSLFLVSISCRALHFGINNNYRLGDG